MLRLPAPLEPARVAGRLSRTPVAGRRASSSAARPTWTRRCSAGSHRGSGAAPWHLGCWGAGMRSAPPAPAGAAGLRAGPRAPALRARGGAQSGGRPLAARCGRDTTKIPRRPLPGRFLTLAREGLRPGATCSLLSSYDPNPVKWAWSSGRARRLDSCWEAPAPRGGRLRIRGQAPTLTSAGTAGAARTSTLPARRRCAV